MNSLTTTDRLKELLPQLFNTQNLAGDYYLRFQLTNEISGLIELKYVQESLTVRSDRITAVPNLPEYVVGLMSSRNQVFLAIDLAHLAGLAPETVNLRQYQTIVVQTDIDNKNNSANDINLFGLTVKKIEGIARILPESFIQTTGNVPDNLRSFVKSTVIHQNNSSNVEIEAKQSILIDIVQLICSKVSS